MAEMPDIIDELIALRENGVMTVSEHLRAGDILARAIDEIGWLRTRAGVVSRGESFADVKREAKHGR